MNAYLKTYLIKWLSRQKAIRIENRPHSYPNNHLFIYPDKWLNNYPATNKPQKEHLCSIPRFKVIYWRLLAGTAIMHGQKKLSTFVAGRAQFVLGRERKTILQTYNPAQPDFNMRQHIARCTFSG